jgi:rhodanese-related sulfurtransferase
LALSTMTSHTSPPSPRGKALRTHRKILPLAGGLSSLSLSSLRDLVSPILVDVRTPSEMGLSIIRGSLTPAQFAAARTDASAAGRPVVCVCTIGLRAGLWARKLAESDYQGDVYVYEGVLMHALDGGEMVARTGKSEMGEDVFESVKKVHCFSPNYRFAPDDWEKPTFSPLGALGHSFRFMFAALLAIVRNMTLRLADLRAAC